jgi:hypothetical protein
MSKETIAIGGAGRVIGLRSLRPAFRRLRFLSVVTMSVVSISGVLTKVRCRGDKPFCDLLCPLWFCLSGALNQEGTAGEQESVSRLPAMHNPRWSSVPG